MKPKSFLLLASLLLAVPIPAPADPAPEPVTVEAAWSAAPVVLDGKLDDAVWKAAPVYALGFSQETAAERPGPKDAGSVQFAWDADYFYAAFHFQDEDIVQEATEDQDHYYRTGDVAELFLKPEKETWYWELYATPNALKTTFFFPGRGRLGLPSSFNYQMEIKTAATADGTLDNWRDHDKGWIAEMAVPRKVLAKMGVPLDPENPWRVFVGRYNYTRYQPDKELSMMPPLSEDDYHRHEQWAHLRLLPAAGNPEPEQ